MVDYREALELQERLRTARQEDELPDVLLTLEHPPVYTRGRRSGPGELPMGEDWYPLQGIEVVETDRGGKVTYHGPGQLVGYPIVRVDDVVAYVRTAGGRARGGAGEEGVAARARPREGHRFTGVWVEDRKIASIGVHLSRGVTTHGFAVNVENDLQPFSWIVPCGLDGVQMTSLVSGDRPAAERDEVLPPARGVPAGARRSGAGSAWSAGPLETRVRAGQLAEQPAAARAAGVDLAPGGADDSPARGVSR